METKWKSLIFGMVLGIALLGSLFFNIFAHEAGHWTAAEIFSMEPKIHIFEAYGGGSFSLFTPNFFTTYNPVGTVGQDILVAFAGPLFNLLITIGLIATYFAIPKEHRTFKITLLFVVLTIPALVSFIANLMPFPSTDGSMIFSYLR